MWYNSIINATWVIHIEDMTHASNGCGGSSHKGESVGVRHDLYTFVTWLIHVCDMNHSCVRQESFMFVRWRIHVCDMRYPHVWHDSFTCVTWPPCIRWLRRKLAQGSLSGAKVMDYGAGSGALCICIYTCMYTCMPMYGYAYIYTYIYKYIYIPTYTLKGHIGIP